MTEQTSSLVVVGCDGSWQSATAVATATREAAARGARLVVLVVAGCPTGRRLAELRASEDAAMARAAAIAKRGASIARATDPSVGIDALVVTSAEDPRLVTLADRAVLLVLGGHGAGGQSAFSLASTSSDLVRRFRTPVLVPRSDRRSDPPVTGRTTARVRVGFRPEVDPPDLVRLAAEEAALRGVELEVVVAKPDGTTDEWSATHQSVRDVAEAVAARADTEVAVRRAAPVEALLHDARSDDLVVVGTRGGGTLAGLVPGSVARGVLDAGATDVLILPQTPLPGADTRMTTRGAVPSPVA